MLRILGDILVVLCPLCAYNECRNIANTGLFQVKVTKIQSQAQLNANFTTGGMRTGQIVCVR